MTFRDAQGILQQEVNRRVAAEFLIQALEKAIQAEDAVSRANAEFERRKLEIAELAAASKEHAAKVESLRIAGENAIAALNERVKSAEVNARADIQRFEEECQKNRDKLLAAHEADVAASAAKALQAREQFAVERTLLEQELSDLKNAIVVENKRLQEVQTLIEALKKA